MRVTTNSFRRLFRVRLIVLLCAITALCLLLGVWANRAHRQHAAIRKITGMGGATFYSGETVRSPDASGGDAGNPRTQSIFDDLYREVEVVVWTEDGWYAFLHAPKNSLRTIDFNSSKRQIDLTPLAELRGVRELHLTGREIVPESYIALEELVDLRVLRLEYTTIDDTALQHVATATHLKELYLNDTFITDRGVRHLKGLKGLSTLDLSGTDVTDEVVDSIARCSALKLLLLHNTQVSDEAVDELKKALPVATIHAGATRGVRWNRDKRKLEFRFRRDVPNSPPLNSVL